METQEFLQLFNQECPACGFSLGGLKAWRNIMCGFQRELDFGDTQAPLPELSVSEQGELIAALAKKHGVSGLNLTAFQYRPRQFAIIKALLEDQLVSELFEENTGGGKTGVFVFEALIELALGHRVMFISVQKGLLDQCLEAFRKFCLRRDLDIEVLSGEIPPKKRAEIHRARPDVTIITKIACLNDFELIDWDGVTLVYRDEVQGDQGKDPGVELNRRLHELSQEAGRNIRIRSMSATTAGNEQKLTVLRHSIQPDRSMFVDAEQVIETDEPGVTIENGQRVVETLLHSGLDPGVSPLAQQLKIEAIRCQKIIEKGIGDPVLFPTPEEQDFSRVPAYDEREQLLSRLLAKGENWPDYYFFLSVWAEFNTYCVFFNYLVTMGRFSFLEHWFYLYAKKHIQPGLYLPEIEGVVRVEKRGIVRKCDERVLHNENLAPLVRSLAQGTTYEVFLGNTEWEDIVRESYDILGPWERGVELTYNAARRRKVIRARNKSMRDPDKLQTRFARDVFDDALNFMAHRELEDSLKIDLIAEALNEYREIIREGRSFGFTFNQRHADFMAETFDWRSGDSGFHSVAAHGARGAGMKEYRNSGVRDFRSKSRNLFWTTIHFAGTGFDIPGARVGVYPGMPDSDPVKWTQSRGRMVGRADDDIFIFVCAARGTPEEARYWAAKSKEKARRLAVQKRFARLTPESK